MSERRDVLVKQQVYRLVRRIDPEPKLCWVVNGLRRKRATLLLMIFLSNAFENLFQVAGSMLDLRVANAREIAGRCSIRRWQAKFAPTRVAIPGAAG